MDTHTLEIADGEPVPAEREVNLDEGLLSYPREAQTLLEQLAPYLAPVTEAVRPLLQAHGLSNQATLEELFAVEGLVEAVAVSARFALEQVDGPGFLPLEHLGYEVQPGSQPAGWDLERIEPGEPFRDLAPLEAPSAELVGLLPEGWSAPLVSVPRHLAYDAEGVPCYPDAPPFEEFWPKCPTNPPNAAPAEVPCLEDPRFVRADARLRELRHFERVPSSFRGFDYRVRLEQSVTLPSEELYRCGEHPSSPSTLASWFGPPGPSVIRLYEPFLELQLEWDVLSLLAGPIDFRTAVLLHEHVHRIEDPEMGTVSAPSDRSYHPAGSVGQDACPGSGTEYDAAYLQALYLGGSEAMARLAADIYGRAQCERLSLAARLLAAAGDIVEVLALGWAASLEVIVTLAACLASPTDRAVRLLSALFPPDMAAMLLLAL